jgi:hypothetical protein|nr:MAG TPA: hypothetical protein [Caudoviricetes sp.]
MKKRFSVPYSDPRWWWGGDFVPLCFGCAHFDGMVNGKVRCAAFPDGIPKAVFRGEHKEPVDGDHGIQFTPYEGTDPL